MLKQIIDKFQSFNIWLATNVVAFMSSIWCVYLFMIWCLVPSVMTNLSDLVLYISSAVIQLVALPLIMVGQKFQAKTSEERAIQDHSAITEMHDEIKEILKELHEKLDIVIK